MQLVIAVGVYFQTITGFGFSMIALGIATAFRLMPLETLAVEINFFTIVTGVLALSGHIREVNWRITSTLLIGVIPGTALGIEFLTILSRSSTNILQMILGLTIMFGSLIQMRRLESKKSHVGFAESLLCGSVAGIIGGMFGVSGPALVHYFYKQPLSSQTVRSTLLMLFSIAAVVRLIGVGLHGHIEKSVFESFIFLLPAAILAAFLARRYPPNLSTTSMRQVGFIFLIFIGLALVGKSVAAYF